MKSITFATGSFLLSLSAAAGGPPPFACPSGADWVPWRLSATEYAETPIFAGNRNTRVAIVCNCTEESPKADPGVWVVTLQENAKAAGRLFGLPGPKAQARPRAGKPADSPPPPQPSPPLPEPPQPGPGQDFYYLQGGACTGVGPGSVMLRTADHRDVKWGVWKIQ